MDWARYGKYFKWQYFNKNSISEEKQNNKNTDFFFPHLCFLLENKNNTNDIEKVIE